MLLNQAMNLNGNKEGISSTLCTFQFRFLSDACHLWVLLWEPEETPFLSYRIESCGESLGREGKKS